MHPLFSELVHSDVVFVVIELLVVFFSSMICFGLVGPAWWRRIGQAVWEERWFDLSGKEMVIGSIAALLEGALVVGVVMAFWWLRARY